MEIYLGDNLVNVIIIRKNNKNIYFRFDEDLNLVVTANKRISEKELKKLIIKNEKSLLNMLLKSKNKKTKDGKFWYLGESYQVEFIKNTQEIEFNNGIITCESEIFLNKFIKEKTKEIFNEEVNDLKKIIKTPDFTLKIRKMKTRWGVCNYKSMTITLNSELIKYPKYLLRYVIVHEMCHFYHHNHSRDFWNMVSIYYPEYKQARKELRS